jgi:tetratricopeptide (TPR) repeat protein
VFFAKKDYVKAEELLSQSLTLGGDSNPEILEHYGDVQFHLNNVAKAIEYWQKSKDKGGNSPSLLKKISTKTFVE